MFDIFNVFLTITLYIAMASMFLPLITDFISRRKGIKYSADLQLFALFYYYGFIIQLIASTMAKVFHAHNLFLFHFFAPVHVVALSFLLLKWMGLKRNAVFLFSALFGVITISGDLVFSSLSEYPDFMLWFNTIVLLILSFLLSYSNDRKKKHLPCEYNSIHIGIYIYSIITLIGLSPANTDFRIYGYFFHALALVFSNIYFARSFRCLYHKNG